jgi:hypothetical protein
MSPLLVQLLATRRLRDHLRSSAGPVEVLEVRLGSEEDREHLAGAA